MVKDTYLALPLAAAQSFVLQGLEDYCRLQYKQ
jgi:hypothetical protein